MPDTLTALAYPISPELLPGRVLREGRYEVRFARSSGELAAIQRLRFEVFNLELGEGLDSSFATGLDIDEYDPVCHHLIVVDLESEDIVGTYRLQTSAMAEAHHGFYSRTEFDLTRWPSETVDRTVELGRACVAKSHRNTRVLFLLWRGLALYMSANQKRFFFGCCSLTSQDPVEGRAVMDYLDEKGHRHPELEVRPQPGFECYPESLEPDPGFRVKIPKLFRIYLAYGAKICGPPAIDREFKTIDFLVVFDVDAMSERQLRTFFG